MPSTILPVSSPPLAAAGDRAPASRLVRAGLLTGVSDGIFASVQSLVTGSTVTRLWQGVASTLLGPAALTGGTRSAAIGLLMHFGVAFGWSAVLLLLVERSPALRRVLDAPLGVVKVAAVYGPCIWLVMSLLVIPALVHRPPTITPRWWVQLVGHVVFVALPMAWAIRGRPAAR